MTRQRELWERKLDTVEEYLREQRAASSSNSSEPPQSPTRQPQRRQPISEGVEMTETQQISKPTETSLRVERTFDASPEDVFDAWTNPEVLRRWWRPNPAWSTPVAEVDLRVGGRYRISMEDPETGPSITAGGEYSEVSRPRRLVYSWQWEEDDGRLGHAEHRSGGLPRRWRRRAHDRRARALGLDLRGIARLAHARLGGDPRDARGTRARERGAHVLKHRRSAACPDLDGEEI